MEGQTYASSWVRQSDRYRVWLTASPEVSAEHPDFGEASEALADEICGRFGDGEAILEFDPAPPESKGAASYLTPAYVLLGHRKGCAGPRGQVLFDGERCPACWTPQGPRNETPLVVENPPAVAVTNASIPAAGASFRLLSELFLSLLTQHERDRLRLQEIVIKGKSRNRFFELLGPAEVPFVSFHNARYLEFPSWRCPTCDYQQFYPTNPDLPNTMSWFIAREDLGRPRPPLVVAGNAHDLSLLMLRSRWQKLSRDPAAKGIDPIPVGIVPTSQLVRSPELRVRTDLLNQD